MEGKRGNTRVTALVVIIAVSCVVLGKNLYIDNSVVFHDEYVYKVSADKQLDQALVLTRGLSPRLPNRLFLGLYGFGSYFGTNYYAFAQFLNVAFWALGLLFLYRLALETGLSATRALLYLCGAALLPLSAYTKYFMPEAMFFALFCAAVYALVAGLHRRIDAPLIIAGFLIGLLYFVKPHAIALAAATGLFLMLLPQRVRLLTLVGTGFVLTIACGKVISERVPAGGSGLGVYGEMLRNLLATLTSGQALGRPLAEVAAGHALFLVGVFALPLLVVVSTLFPPLRLREKDAAQHSPLWLLSGYLLITGVVLIGMSIAFTALAGELGRIHSRYYFFLAPLGLLALFHFRDLRLTRAGVVVALALGAGGPVLLGLFGPGYSAVLPISLVSDCPEWGFIFLGKPAAWLGLMAIAVTSSWAVLRPKQTGWLVAVLALLSVASSVDVVMQQKGIFRNGFTTGREAVAVEAIIGPAAMNSVVVVGEDRGTVSKFLFFLTSTPMVEELPAGTSLDTVSAKHPDATHIIAISPQYVLSPTLRCTSDIATVNICTVIR